MVSRTLIQFPFFAPPAPPHNHRPATEVRFSRWNNANAEKFERRRRTQEEIEAGIRIAKRYEAVRIIMNDYNPAPPYPVSETFKSTGTPSAPSKPSIQGKKSKYSRRSRESHPAFKPFATPRQIPNESMDKSSDTDEAEAEAEADEGESGADKPAIDIKVGEGGVLYKFPEAPFAYQYSYTETPKLKPSKLREPLVSPFGANTMPRPWTGRKPHPESKKTLPEFDSFRLPPPDMKGVKPVQSPGPFLPGSGPKYVTSREEILGEPLTKEEVELLIESCKKSARQHNIGRDGLTHNMLEIIHAHWKRRRVCKIKCKGVCTVDMDNVCEKLEEKTGGKIIYRKGGTIYLFRGRNYNYKTRPRFPLMLWRPVTPVYPRLVKRVPEGLTLEEVTEMRKKGRNLRPILKLSKNGVYHDLAEHVREAFEACDLVRINCEGLHTSDCRKIGAKLKDVVPCVLISFEREHILMWKGRDWVSSLPEDKDKPESGKGSEDDNAASSYPSFDGQAIASMSEVTSLPVTHINPCNLSASTSPLGGEHAEIVRSHGTKDGSEDSYPESSNKAPLDAPVITTPEGMSESETPVLYEGDAGENSRTLTEYSECKTRFDDSVVPENEMGDDVNASESTSLAPLTGYKPQGVSEDTTHKTELVSSSSPWTERVLLLWKQAIESGSAVLLDDSSYDPDIIYKRSFELARSAPPGPIFRRKPLKESVSSVWVREGNLTKEFWVRDESSRKETIAPITTVPVRQGNSRKISKRERLKKKMKEMKDIREEYLNVVPKGNLAVDELAKLLA